MILQVYKKLKISIDFNPVKKQDCSKIIVENQRSEVLKSKIQSKKIKIRT